MLYRDVHGRVDGSGVGASMLGELEGDGVVLRGGERGGDGADDVLELRVLAGELFVGAVLRELGAHEGAQILAQLDAHEEDEAVRHDHPEQNRQVLPLAALRLHPVHLPDHVPPRNGLPDLLPVQHVRVERQPHELVHVHPLQKPNKQPPCSNQKYYRTTTSSNTKTAAAATND
jgi:hypothetical protein